MIKLLLKLVAVAFIFVVPILYLIYKYQGEPEAVIVQSVGIIPTLMIIAIVMIALLFLLSLIKAKIINDKAGNIAIGFYGVIMLAFGIITWSILTWVIKSAQLNYALFISNMNEYRQTVFVVMGSVFVGLIMVGVNIFIELKK